MGKLFEYINKDGINKYFVAPNLNLESGMCAKYSRLVAEMIFGIKYTPADAWNLKYVNNVIIPMKRLENGKEGDIVTFFFPLSKYNTKGNKNLDMNGNTRNCTHAGLLYDFRYDGEPIILHQYKSIIEIGLLSEIEKERKIHATEIIRANS